MNDSRKGLHGHLGQIAVAMLRKNSHLQTKKQEYLNHLTPITDNQQVTIEITDPSTDPSTDPWMQNYVEK